MVPAKKYSTLLGLYVAQSIPMSFFATVVPVIMRQEAYSLESIGLIQLIKLPWILKFLWAPLVDRHSPTVRHYRRWIVSSEIFYALIIFGIGFFSLEVDFRTIIILLLAAFTLSATQDIATDAFAIRILKPKQRGFGNSMQSSGNFLGTMLGGGVLLMLYPQLGWSGVIYLLCGIVLVALIPLVLFTRRSPREELDSTSSSSRPVHWTAVPTFFTQPDMWKRVILVGIFYAGILGMLVMLKPLMVDLGFGVKKIAFISGILGTGVGVLCALGTGWVIRRWGNRKTLIRVALFNLLSSTFFILFVRFELATNWIYLGSVLLWGGYGMSTTIIYTICMNAVRKGLEGTDYSIQIVITHISGLSMAVVSGRIGDAFGYGGLFTLELIIGLLVLIFVGKLYHEPTAQPNLVTPGEIGIKA